MTCGGRPSIRSPLNAIVPALAGTTPMIALSVVLLPTPLRPTRQAIWPASTVRLTPCRTCAEP